MSATTVSTAYRVNNTCLTTGSWMYAELVFEVPLPQARLSDVVVKVAEFLNAGANAVCVIDTNRHTATVYRDKKSPEHFTAADELTLPDILPGFRVPVRQFFE